MVARQTLDLLVGVRILPGERGSSGYRPLGPGYEVALIERPLRLSVRTKDSQSLKRGSTPLGARKEAGKSFYYKVLPASFFRVCEKVCVYIDKYLPKASE